MVQNARIDGHDKARRKAPEEFRAFPAVNPRWEGLIQNCLKSMTIDPCSAHEWVCAPSWRRESARFMDPLLIWIAGGRGRAWIGDPAAKYELGPGNIMIIPKNVIHSILPGKGETMRFIIVHVYIRVFGSADIFQLLGLSGIFGTSDRKTADRCFTELAREYAHQPPGWRENMQAYLNQVMIGMLRHHGEKIALPKIGNEGKKLTQLIPAFDMIERKYQAASLSVREIARAACVSEVYLRKLFRQCLGMSPVLFIQQRRISHACRLLRQTESGLKEIAGASGFSDVYYFCRVFRNVMYSTPGNYRNFPENHLYH